MPGVEYRLGKQVLKKEVQGDVRALLTNRAGSYFMAPSSSSQISKYDGFFIYDNEEKEMYKILDSIGIDFNSLTNEFSSVYLNETEISMPENKNALVIIPKEQLTFRFDVKKSYDPRVWGRNFKFTEEKNQIIFEFTKTTDSKEDSTHGEEEYKFFIVVRHNGTYTLFNDWIRCSIHMMLIASKMFLKDLFIKHLGWMQNEL